jgi:ABC-type dipeptide/oligopeptide/nickel transport system ATPase component
MYSRKQNEQEEPDWQDQPDFRYRGSKARYHKQKLDCYKGNPFIEALPPIYKEEEIGPLLRFDPGYDEQCRQWASELRLHLILDALRFVEPLSNHLALAQLLDGLLRSGYVGRNPFPRKAHLLNHRTRLKRMKENLSVLPALQLTGREVSIIGLSGVGKSTALRSIFALYDQIINHSRYHGQLFTVRQLVYLKLECPQDGSPAGLCKAFFKAVDRLLETNTYRLYVKNGKRTVDEMMIDMAEVASRHFLGLLAIDEIQNLRDAKGNWAAQVHNFLVQLDNELGIPVVLVGTPKAQSILTGEFRRARRASGLGAFPWDRMQEDEEWDVFTKALWKYQYVRKPIPYTDELRHALYFESQGITDLAVKVFMLAQIEAITGARNDEEEEVTKGLMESVAQDRLRYMQRFLNALRSTNPDVVKEYEDIAPIDLEFAVSEAIATLRRRHTETSSSTGETQAKEQEGKTETDSGERQQTQSQQPSKKKPDITKLVLVKTVLKGELDGIDAYESLKNCGFTRSAWEHFKTGSGTDSEVLAA